MLDWNYDLHSHSHCSDGHLSPEQLLQRAVDRGLHVLALTDHDTLAGLDQAHDYARKVGLKLINGIEFSCQWQKRGIHVVGLDFEHPNATLLQRVEQQRETRWQRAKTIATRLQKLGLERALEGAIEHCRLQRGESDSLSAVKDEDLVPGRPHFAAYMVASGFCENTEQAFKRYLGSGKPGDVPSLWPELVEVVSWIVDAHGIAVLAHPAKYGLTRSKLRALLRSFVEAGGTAMEVVSGQQTQVLTEDLAKLANDHGLLASIGSDFHQPDLHWQELACATDLPESSRPVWSAFKHLPTP